MVFIPGICMQLLDIGISHEPCCHVTTTFEIPNLEVNQTCLTPIIKCGKFSVLNLATLDIIDLKVTNLQLIQSFKSINSLENKLSILHYLLVHVGDMETAVEVYIKIFTLYFLS